MQLQMHWYRETPPSQILHSFFMTYYLVPLLKFWVNHFPFMQWFLELCSWFIRTSLRPQLLFDTMPPFFRQLTKTDLGCEWRRCHETPWCTLFSMTSSKVASHIGTKFFWNRIYFPNFQCSLELKVSHVASVHEEKKPFKCNICDYACCLELHQFMKEKNVIL